MCWQSSLLLLACTCQPQGYCIPWSSLLPPSPSAARVASSPGCSKLLSVPLAWLHKLTWFLESCWSGPLCPPLTHTSPIHYWPGDLNEFCLPELFLKTLDLLKLFIFPRNDSLQAPGNKWCLGTISLFLFQATGIPQISTSVPKPWRVSITSRQLWVSWPRKRIGFIMNPGRPVSLQLVYPNGVQHTVCSSGWNFLVETALYQQMPLPQNGLMCMKSNQCWLIFSLEKGGENPLKMSRCLLLSFLQEL